MDLDTIDRLSFSGNALNAKERATLEVVMAKKSRDEPDLTEVLFWGKIQGTENSYLICVGLQDRFAGVPAKKFYYLTSTGKPELAELPDLNAAFVAEVLKQSRQPFGGDPSQPLDEDADPGDDEDAEVCSEKHRLSYVVRQIDDNVSIVPRGAYIVTPSHRVLKNPAYEGLSHSMSSSLKSFFHFRQPVTLKSIGALERKGLVKATDFLDPIAGDLPFGCWSMKQNASKTCVTLSSLRFPGFHFFSRINSSSFGGAYFGNGIENTDLIFMI